MAICSRHSPRGSISIGCQLLLSSLSFVGGNFCMHGMMTPRQKRGSGALGRAAGEWRMHIKPKGIYIEKEKGRKNYVNRKIIPEKITAFYSPYLVVAVYDVL